MFSPQKTNNGKMEILTALPAIGSDANSYIFMSFITVGGFLRAPPIESCHILILKRETCNCQREFERSGTWVKKSPEAILKGTQYISIKSSCKL